jgi:hypothetical protein
MSMRLLLRATYIRHDSCGSIVSMAKILSYLIIYYRKGWVYNKDKHPERKKIHVLRVYIYMIK